MVILIVGLQVIKCRLSVVLHHFIPHGFCSACPFPIIRTVIKCSSIDTSEVLRSPLHEVITEQTFFATQQQSSYLFDPECTLCCFLRSLDCSNSHFHIAVLYSVCNQHYTFSTNVIVGRLTISTTPHQIPRDAMLHPLSFIHHQYDGITTQSLTL